MSRRLILIVGASVLMLTANAARAQKTAAGQGIWSGVYTEAQAARGLEAYTANCSSCHKADLLGFDDSDGFAAELKGQMFLEHWVEDSLQALFTRMKSMPPNEADSVPDSARLDILTYLLKENGFPAGAAELKEAALSGIRVTGKDGPGQIPEGSLVEVNGCLLQSRQKAWIVYKASDAVRTRETGRPDDATLKAAAEAPPGTHTYRLTGADFLKLQNRMSRKVVVRGFIKWSTNDDQLSVVSLEQAGSAVCQ